MALHVGVGHADVEQRERVIGPVLKFKLQEP
jgi:hypothetical protein